MKWVKFFVIWFTFLVIIFRIDVKVFFFYTTKEGIKGYFNNTESV